MQKVVENHIFNGVQRDLSVSKQPIQFLYDARNIRLTAREGDTLMSITNEKGTSDTTVAVDGDYLGHCLLNEYLVVFSTELIWNEGHTDVIGKEDIITRLDLSEGTPAKVELYRGELGFSKNYPIKTVGSYETSAIQKVYWTDGHNQPRIINITAERLKDSWDNTKTYWENLEYNPYSFDFVQELALEEEVSVCKILGATGEFAPGVIQYAFTYYNKYGQETNIFHTTPLYYISYKERGAKPDDKVENAFRITVKKVDTKFKFMRIYSIQRTSLNATPICKRIQDISLEDITNRTVSFIDTGLSGNTVDPTELLYKGGEIISAGTLEQKDGTLFLGDIEITRNHLSSMKSDIQSAVRFTNNATRKIYPTVISFGDYYYANQLTAYDSNVESTKKSIPCGGFKTGDWYRCGVQFQHKSGKWSEPIFVNDVKVVSTPIDGGNNVLLPRINGKLSLSAENRSKLINTLGYKKVRPVVVFPEMQDRVTVCQGIANPTMYTTEQRNNGHLDAQASWFFRCPMDSYVNSIDLWEPGVTIGPHFSNGGTLPYTSRQINDENPVNPGTAYDPNPRTGFKIRQVEVQGDFESENQFRIDLSIVTLNSPDIEFNDQLSVMDYTGLKAKKIGEVSITRTLSDIDIQTESPTVSNSGGGFVHKAFSKNYAYGIVAGLFYDDYIVDDCLGDDKHLGAYPKQRAACKYMVYPWQGSGSLNNDMNRPTNKGTATAILKKKVISNLRYGEIFHNYPLSITFLNNAEPQLYNSDEATVIKLKNTIYQGNIDTSLVPDNADGSYFCFDGYTHKNIDFPADYWVMVDAKTSFASNAWFKTWSMNPDIQNQNGLRYWNTTDKKWYWCSGIGDNSSADIGNEFVDLDMRKNPVRMKYKSTPHIVFMTASNIFNVYNNDPDYPKVLDSNQLPLVELYNKVNDEYNPNNPSSSAYNTIFGGRSMDALRENTWVPCGESVPLSTSGDTTFYYEYGDTYFQRWDCLKTYPFTREDPNQIVEICSFTVETRVNIDGRYDRNRGQASNINMSPQNFNLMNLVYSQVDNFFSYKIQDDDFYKDVKYPNQVTWTKEKNAGADVDNWTNITLASTYDMDGSKGKVEELVTYKDQIFCFQEKGISNILFNSRVQIPASDGVPIEISNSYKVDGYRYISDGIGCNNKLLVKKTPAGIYFIDSIGSHLFHISENLTDLSEQCNMTTLFKSKADSWQRLVYDGINHDVYAVNTNEALCFSEKLNQFTGTYDYGGISLIETYGHHVFTLKDSQLWKMFEGEYCQMFGVNYPWDFTFVSNGINEGAVNLDKTFTNIEFRAGVEGDGELDSETGKFTPALPFDSLRVWNEYQHGRAALKNLSGHAAMQHHTSDGDSSLKRKFRIWRSDIPRNNAPLEEDAMLQPSISRKVRKPVDRMRNPWLYLKFQKEAAGEGKVLPMTELHDMQVIYYI